MKKINLGIIGTTVTALLMGTSQPSLACTDFRLIAKDKTVTIARSMEFSEDLKSNLRSSPRNRVFQNTTPDGKPGMTWKATYGYLYLDGLNVDSAVDGMNEQGLSFEDLYLPGNTTYQAVHAGQESHALPYTRLGDWILGNFKSVEEVRAALPKIIVYAQAMPNTGNLIFPLHAAIHDATGKSIVVEFVNGKMNVYDNKIGVLTNSPTFDWHLTNLRNYINLTPTNPEPVEAAGITFAATGQGAGMVGLPGDTSPPSRFVKTAIMLQTVLQPKNATEAVNVAQHIINNVDIPLGFVRAKQNNNIYTDEMTQWVVFKDLTNKIFYYRTYGNLDLRSVSLSKVNLAENATPLKMPLATPQAVQDMTDQFAKSSSN